MICSILPVPHARSAASGTAPERPYLLPGLQEVWQPTEQPLSQPGLQDAFGQRAAAISLWDPKDVFRDRFSISRTKGSRVSFAYAMVLAATAPTTAPAEINAVFKNFLRPSLE
jgi:hypothetical protein